MITLTTTETRLTSAQSAWLLHAWPSLAPAVEVRRAAREASTRSMAGVKYNKTV